MAPADSHRASASDAPGRPRSPDRRRYAPDRPHAWNAGRCV